MVLFGMLHKIVLISECVKKYDHLNKSYRVLYYLLMLTAVVSIHLMALGEILQSDHRKNGKMEFHN